MSNSKEICIIGGGLAGLSLAILTAKNGWKVTVLEKGDYPRPKVCGEYISMESYDFLESLGINLSKLNTPIIQNFTLTTEHGISASTKLNTGGFGISRMFLDHELYKIALENGVSIKLHSKVTGIEKNNLGFTVQINHGESLSYPLVVGTFGRISGLQENKKQNSFVGVKYHVDEGPKEDTIEIHQFNGGYCGVSKVENGAYNLCYLVNSNALKLVKGNIEALEEKVLSRNPSLKKRLQSKKLTEPVVTSKIFFGTQNSMQQGYILLGDAAGFIPPLTGNGMSLAFRSAKQLFLSLQEFQKHGEYNKLLQENHQYIQHYLKFRIKKGRFLQSLLFIQNPIFNKMLCYALVYVPGLLQILSKQAVGKKI